jgi:hypothetical protein
MLHMTAIRVGLLATLLCAATLAPSAAAAHGAGTVRGRPTGMTAVEQRIYERASPADALAACSRRTTSSTTSSSTTRRGRSAI